MNTNVGRFKMLALRTMAGDELKDDVNNTTSSFKRSSMTFCMCVCLYDRNQLCIEHYDCINCTLTFCAAFCQSKPFRRLCSEMVRDSIVLSVASQQSNLWRNVS